MNQPPVKGRCRTPERSAAAATLVRLRLAIRRRRDKGQLEGMVWLEFACNTLRYELRTARNHARFLAVMESRCARSAPSTPAAVVVLGT